MSRQRRRRFGLVLLALFVAQLVAVPVGACEQEHEGSGHMSGEMASAGHAMGIGVESMSPMEHSAAAEHEPIDVPDGCTAVATCGAAAVQATEVSSGVVFSNRVEVKPRAVPDRPTAIVLGLLTPPPKI